jgi:sarcosine oxidase subunit gamma
MADVRIEAEGPFGMVALRGDHRDLSDPVAEVTGLDVPERRLSTAKGDRKLIWMSPDELLLICDYDEAPTLAEELGRILADSFASVVVVSDARAVFDLSGPGAEDVILSLAPVNIEAMAPTEVRRTRLAQVAAALWREGEGWRLICFRSVAVYVEDLLRNAAGTHPALQRG